MQIKSHYKNIIENDYLRRLAGTFLRAPNQLNALLESDSELVDIGKNQILAVTYDAIVEEIHEGLYTEPYQIGWMGITISISDLAAVGAEVIGMLLDLRIPVDLEMGVIKKIQKGINDACKYYGCFILGGDTNNNNTVQIGSTGIGLCKNKALMRTGMKPTDSVYVSGKMGLGSSYAYSKFIEKKKLNFLPKARIREGQLLGKYASSCIDTSDGFIPAVCNLMDVNNFGFELNITLKDILHESCLKILNQNDLPDWVFLAGPHGEYELLFTVDADKVKAFEKHANKIDWYPIRLGHVTDQNTFKIDSMNSKFDLFEVANVYAKNTDMNPQQYLLELLKIHKKITL